MAAIKRHPNDGQKKTAVIKAFGEFPSFTVDYRPALPREVKVYLYPRDNYQGGEAIQDAQNKLVLDHLIGWSLTERNLRPWDPNASAEKDARIHRDSLELMDHRSLEELANTICRYSERPTTGDSSEEEQDAKNSVSDSASS